MISGFTIVTYFLEIFRFVAETMQNRVLRFYQQPLGVYHGSVFYQFNGGVGPTALTMDDSGNLIVAHADIRGNYCILIKFMKSYL
jgi:hypothetical protein